MPFDPDAYLASKPAPFDPDAYLASEPPASERSGAMKSARAAEFGARGFKDSALETIGFIPDMVTAGLRAVGLNTPEKGYYTDALKSGFDTLGRTVSAPINSAVGDSFGSDQPTTALESGAYGAGRGAADAASLMVPGAVMARTAQAGGTAANVGRTLAAQPAMQTAAGMAGGATSEVTGSDAAGMAAALAVPVGASGIRRAVTPVGRQLSPEEQRLATLAENMGIHLTPGQATGSIPLQTAESSFTQLPFTGRTQQAIYDQQRQAFNRAALDQAGINADRGSPAVLDSAFQTIGRQFDDAIRQTPRVNIDPQFEQGIAQAIQNYGRRLPTDVRPVFDSYVDDITQMTAAARQPGGQSVFVDGQTYHNISSNLRAAARNAKARPDLQEALGNLSDAFDGAMTRSVAPDVAQAWQEARRNYRNLLQIDKAMSMAPQADAAAGNIPFAGLNSAVRQADTRGYARGRGDLNDVARVGQFLGSTRIPDSGTAQRTTMMNALRGAPVATAAGSGVMSGGDPMTMAATLAATYGTPPIVQALMNSGMGQAYLRNNLLPPGPLGSQRQMLAKVLAGQEIGNVTDGM